MKANRNILILAAFAASLIQGICQNTLKFTSATATPENAILLSWASTNHELYQIQFADALGTNADGTTTWNVLYDNYPSHGTNTFVGDFGNYDIIPAISHPKNRPMRFYRVVDVGTDDDVTDTPSITITSPTNGDVLSGQFTVSISATCSNLPDITTKLYVDGQEMDKDDDGNFVINTCEWPNGSHILFAVANAASTLPGPSGYFPISTSHGVSAYVPVTFSNLISRIAFSQPFFEPSLGQTQEVTASFAANCDWTLQIIDESSNVVRNASGSGVSMAFDWDGTGDGETNIPEGIYYYNISAQTNGQSFSGGAMMSESMSSSETSSELYAIPSDGSGSAVPLALYPPGTDTNGFTFFEASSSEMRPSPMSSSMSASFSSSASAGASGSSSESSTAPSRPPTSPNKNAAGTYGVAYFDWKTPQTNAIPRNGIGGVCHVNGDTSGTYNSVSDSPIPPADDFAKNFIRTMSKKGWKIQYLRSDSILHAQDMRRSDQGYGGSELFTTGTIGLFLDHGDYGVDPDYSAGSSGSYQTYFRCSSDSGDNGWLRMCQIGFGGNLKWMGLLACNSLNTFDSMSMAGGIPLKTTHMVCGCATDAAIGPDIGAFWAKYMFGGFLRSPETVANAWFKAGHDQYIEATNMNLSSVTFRVASYPECTDDKLKSYIEPYEPSSAPGNLVNVDQQVYP